MVQCLLTDKYAIELGRAGAVNIPKGRTLSGNDEAPIRREERAVPRSYRAYRDMVQMSMRACRSRSANGHFDPPSRRSDRA
jgi:hypothetical protein